MNPEREKTDFKKKKIVWLSFIPAVYLNLVADLEILRALAKRYEVHLICPYFSIKHRFKNSKIHVIAIPIENRKPFSVIASNILLLLFLPFYFPVLRPDFIITKTDGSIFGFMSTLLLKRCLGDRGFKVVLDIRSTPVRTVRFPFRFNFTVSMAKKMFDGMTIITSLMKKEVCQKFGIDPNFVGVWSVGASTALFKPERYVHQGKKLRKKLGLLDKFVVLYHGAFSPSRGLLETVNAFAMIVRRYPNIILFLLGKGSVVPHLKKLIQEKQIQNNVIVHDAVDYSFVPGYIAMCDVGIVPLPNLPYWRHQCPLKLLEYLAMKKVVVITDIPAHREIVGNKEYGVYVSSTNPTEIANAVTYVYENRDKLKEWGASGREIITKNYNWEKAAKDLENYLLSLRRMK